MTSNSQVNDTSSVHPSQNDNLQIEGLYLLADGKQIKESHHNNLKKRLEETNQIESSNYTLNNAKIQFVLSSSFICMLSQFVYEIIMTNILIH